MLVTNGLFEQQILPVWQIILAQVQICLHATVRQKLKSLAQTTVKVFEPAECGLFLTDFLTNLK